MNSLIIIVWVWLGMAATSFWEAYVEGRNAWDKKKLGWKINIGKFKLTAYHFWLFGVMWPVMLFLPLIINGWDLRLFGILCSAYFSGLIIEDFLWFVVNPVVKFKEFFSRFTNYYPWLTFGRVKIPLGYVLGAIVSILFWYFLWR